MAIERDYRAGLLSLREMAVLHGVSHMTIQKHANKSKWERDLGSRIRTQADNLVNKAAVTTVVTLMDAVTEDEAVNANALVVANVRLRHRKTITRLQALSESLLGELEAQCLSPELLAEFGEMLRAPNDYGADRLNDLYQKIISTPGRIDAMKKLTEVAKMAVTMEREAWSMDKVADDKPVTGLAALLQGMRRSALPVVLEVEHDDDL